MSFAAAHQLLVVSCTIACLLGVYPTHTMEQKTASLWQILRQGTRATRNALVPYREQPVMPQPSSHIVPPLLPPGLGSGQQPIFVLSNVQMQGTQVESNTSVNQDTDVTVQGPPPVTFQQVGESIGDYFKHNKLKIAACSYLAVLAWCLRHVYQIENATAWASWKQEISLDDLVGGDQHTLSAELLHTIQERYLNPRNPIDHIYPFMQFVRAIEYEEQLIRRYLWYAPALNKLCLSWLLPVGTARIERARGKLTRIRFIHGLFNSWATEHNIAQTIHL